MKYRVLILLLFALICFQTSNLFAQKRYWVYLTDKNGVDFNPYQYFDIKAINRRIQNGISLFDSTDFPLRKDYILQIEKITGPIDCQLRWFNSVSVTASDFQINKIKNLPFVKNIIEKSNEQFITAEVFDSLLIKDDSELLDKQIDVLEGNLFAENGFTGKGIRIAVFDAGFPSVDTNPVFSYLRDNKRIIAVWDFAKKKPFVYDYNPHGTMVLSCIAGITNNHKIGLAIDSEFLLARTEIDRESYVEEEYWLQAVEWADKNGADIISSSLAYTHERYYTFEMNGKTSLVSKAANMAANKGMLVINAMGNDGNRDWKIMATPADADSVLSVGAISPYTEFHSNFSSYGPTADFRLKPNVVALGQVIVSGESKLEKVKGTSFSTPLIAGFAACAWQSMPFLTNMQLFEKIEESANLYPYYDYAHGYGVPQASYFIKGGKAKVDPTFKFVEKDDTVYIEIDKKYIEKQFLQKKNYLYYHIENKKSYLEDYWLVDVYKSTAAKIALKDLQGGYILRANYKGFTDIYNVK